MAKSLVLLHGFTGRSQSWSGIRRSLPDSVPVFAPNLLGHSPKQITKDPVTFDEYIDRLAVRMSVSGIEDAHLVGYSMGGRIALGLLLQHPSLFSSATLIGAHPGLENTQQRSERSAQEKQWAEDLRLNGVEAFVEAWERQPLFESQKKLSVDTLLNQRVLRLSHDSEGLALAIEALGLSQMPNYGLRAREINVPVEIMVGELDLKFQNIGERLASIIPKGELLIIQGTGHNVVLEQPDVVVNQIKSWL